MFLPEPSAVGSYTGGNSPSSGTCIGSLDRGEGAAGAGSLRPVEVVPRGRENRRRSGRHTLLHLQVGVRPTGSDGDQEMVKVLFDVRIGGIACEVETTEYRNSHELEYKPYLQSGEANQTEDGEFASGFVCSKCQSNNQLCSPAA